VDYFGRKLVVNLRAKLDSEIEVAGKCYQETLRLLEGLNQPEIERVSLTNLGFVAERAGQLDVASDSYKRAIEVIESGRRNISSETPRLAYFGRRLDPYRRMVVVSNSMKREADSFIWVERSQERTLLDLLSTREYERGISPLN